MFCKNCGTQLPDGTKFCTSCGNNLEAEAVQPVETASAETVVLTPEARPDFAQPVYTQPTYEQPAYTQPAYTQPAYEQPANAQPAFAQPWQGMPVAEPPKKKGKKLLALLIPVIALVVAAAVVAVLALGPLKGFWLKNFGDDAEYRDFVQAKSTEAATSTISKVYSTAVTTLSGEAKDGGAAEFSMKLNVGEKTISMLEDLTEAELGEKISMDWARDIELKFNANAKDDLQQIGAALNIGSKEIAVVDAILNMDEGKLFVAILNLSDDYLAVDFSEYLGDIEESTAALAFLQDPELIAALPNEEELNKVLNKYVALAISSFDDVEQSSETIEVDGVKQKLTVLETKIDGDALLDAANAVLEELAKDKDVEKIVRRVLDYLAGQEELGLEIDTDEAWESVEETIDEALESLEDVDGDDMEGEIVLTQYVNNSHEVVGYALEVEDEQVLQFVEVKSGDKIAFELKVPNALEISGKGTEKKGVINAEYIISVEAPNWDENYDVTYEKMEVATISLVDFKVEGNLVNGKIRLAPTEELLDQMDLPAAASSVVNLADLQLELALASTEATSSVGFNVLTGEDLLIGLTFSAAETSASDITVPSEAYDIEEIEEWAKGLDVQKILSILKEAGLPVDEVVGLVLGNSVDATVKVPASF